MLIHNGVVAPSFMKTANGGKSNARGMLVGIPKFPPDIARGGTDGGNSASYIPIIMAIILSASILVISYQTVVNTLKSIIYSMDYTVIKC